MRFTRFFGGFNGAYTAQLLSRLRDRPQPYQEIVWAHVTGERFRRLRNSAYAAAGILPGPARACAPRVLVLNGRTGDKRGLLNVRNVADTLRAAFPEAHVSVRTIADLTARQQLEELSETTVLVSNIGSRSFRLALLRDGASAVLIGPPQVRRFPLQWRFPRHWRCL